MKRLKILFVACALVFCSLVSHAAYDTLGATVIPKGNNVSTRFAIWNPDNITPASVFIQLPGQTEFTEYSLTLQQPYEDNGVNKYTDIYSATVPKNCNLCQYYFKFNGVTVRDPYAKMTTGYCTDDSSISETQYVNDGTLANPVPATCPADSPPVPGPCNQVVVDLSQIIIDFNSKRPALANLTDAIIYELQVMDYTGNPDSGVKNGGTFTGLAQSGTYKGQATALQHLKDLGITHIQIMPMYTYSFTGYSYNWGYNPVEYNVPQAKFSKYSVGDYMNRIQELQKMVSSFHSNDIRVVMDVVFNHTYAASIFASNSPKTNSYYLTDSQGQLIDDTGCGNTVDVANPMVSNMVADSMAFWMKIYGIDGYRFDEMASFDYAITSAWAQYLNNLNPGQNYIYYGEPWNCGSEGINNGCNSGNISCTEYMNNGALTPGVGCFNGSYRNALIGPSQQSNTYGGYIFNQLPGGLDIQGLMGQMAEGFKGSIRGSDYTTDSVPPNLDDSWVNAYANMPSEAINYVSCHDGLCIWDKICCQDVGGGAESWSNKYFQQIDMFSAGILMTSQGVAFISEGDEFLRTKDGNNNSYNSPLSVNWISWNAKVENLNVYKYYRKLIALRKANQAFRQGSLTDITSNSKVFTAENSETQDGVLIGLLKDNSGNQFIVIYNSGSDYNYTVPAGDWVLLTNINDCGLGIENYPIPGTAFTTNNNVLCCGTSVTVLANVANPQKPVVPSL
ncbi:MAG: alpha-amylase family glycosyl hydrolase [Candidatus Tenebribacter mawsonii]|nr:alpha-amylase family glycosyl hydrolase [Candidatus Tenebribacter mawsonii]